MLGLFKQYHIRNTNSPQFNGKRLTVMQQTYHEESSVYSVPEDAQFLSHKS